MIKIAHPDLMTSFHIMHSYYNFILNKERPKYPKTSCLRRLFWFVFKYLFLTLWWFSVYFVFSATADVNNKGPIHLYKTFPCKIWWSNQVLVFKDSQTCVHRLWTHKEQIHLKNVLLVRAVGINVVFFFFCTMQEHSGTLRWLTTLLNIARPRCLNMSARLRPSLSASPLWVSKSTSVGSVWVIPSVFFLNIKKYRIVQI